MSKWEGESLGRVMWRGRIVGGEEKYKM